MKELAGAAGVQREQSTLGQLDLFLLVATVCRVIVLFRCDNL